MTCYDVNYLLRRGIDTEVLASYTQFWLLIREVIPVGFFKFKLNVTS